MMVEERNNKVALFLYDYTGLMAKPWVLDGYTCYCVDIQHKEGIHKQQEGLYFIGMDVRDFVKYWNGKVSFIASFPPCTDLAVSGAAHFARKLQRNPNYLKEAMELVYIARDFSEEQGCPWLLENPISRIATQWRKPDYYFNPNDYGGYLPEDDVHPNYPQYIEPRDAYPKKTCLWVGGGFVIPPTIPVQLLTSSKLHNNKLGGRSLRTKNIRSSTPRGFAKAVWLANKENND